MKPVEWDEGVVRILDQSRLPREEIYLDCREPSEVGEAIGRLAVRGAPLLGIVAAYAMALAAERSPAKDAAALQRDLRLAGRALVATRPTAVNISWAVDRVLEAARDKRDAGEIRDAALDAARRIEEEDREACDAMGKYGADLVPEKANILTHCNTGHLCTGGIGTAQGVIETAHRAGKRVHVWVDETRPVLQGARLTAWELQRLGIPMTLVADAAAGSLMAAGRVELVVTGADRIAANGDVANKIGTYALAVLANHHGIPFYVAAPVSTIDPGTASGAGIPIEERDPPEVTSLLGAPIADDGTPAANPAFDVTPAGLVTAIVTDLGVVRNPSRSGLQRLLREGKPT